MGYFASRTCGPLTRRLQRHRFRGKKLVMTLMTWVVERMLLLGSGNIVNHTSLVVEIGDRMCCIRKAAIAG
jgi:hypothetical protein